MGSTFRHPATAIITWFLAYFGARAGLEATSLTPAARVVVALLPVLPFAWFLVVLIRGMRALDELHRKVQLEALAIAYPFLTLLLMTLGLLELAVPLPPEDLSYRHVWGLTPVIYFASVTLTWRQYR